MNFAQQEDIDFLLQQTKTWAVVGLGTDPDRPAYRVAQFLQKHGKKIVPVHPRAETVLGETGFPSLSAAVAAGIEIDVVDCFVASKRVGEIVREAATLKLPAVWLQLEVIDEPAVTHAREQGLRVVMDRCPAIEWPR